MECSRQHSWGFTLVELLVALALLVLIMLATSYVFQTSTNTVSQSQGATEVAMRLHAFEAVFLRDIKSIEHQGVMVLGARQQQAWGSEAEREAGRQRMFRNDWINFFTNSEQTGGIDSRAFAQWTRTFYGHSRESDPNGWYFDDETSWHPNAQPCSLGQCGGPWTSKAFTTDWMLLRNQMLIASAMRVGGAGATGDSEVLGGTNAPLAQRDFVAHLYRDLRWSWWFNSTAYAGSIQINYGPQGNVTTGGPTGTGTGRQAIYEPIYYHSPFGRGVGSGQYHGIADIRGVRALAPCATFQVQYAMPQDLRAGTDGGVFWRDPPMFDPANVTTQLAGSDTNGHKLRVAVVTDPTQGRLTFAPGDVWPAMLKVTIEMWDPAGRVDESVTATIIAKVP